MNIYQKILSIMQNIKYLAKDDEVKFNTTKYKALSEEKVTSIMRAELIAHRLVVFPIRQDSSRTGQITHVDVTYRMVNVDDPQEYIDIASCGDGADSQDKGSGKAMTYAFKYMWLRTFALPTGEDPDKISSAELDEKMKEEAAEYVCADCGNPITTILKRNKEPWPPHEIAEYTRIRYGRALCKACIEAEESRKKAEKQVTA